MLCKRSACRSMNRLQLAPTTDPRHGDYQTNAAMVLGKKLKQNPRNLAGRSSRICR